MHRARYACSILAAIILALLTTALIPVTVFALELSHEVSSTPTEVKPPFTVSPYDEVVFEIIAEFNANEEKPDEIDIDIHDCLLFNDVDGISVFSGNKKLDYDGAENIEKENGSVKIYLSPLPETADRIELYYTCTAREIVSIGTAGMYNNAHVITHVNNIRENESREVTQESRAVHCWYVELWTFDSNKPKQTIVTSSNSSGGTTTTTGQDMHQGQSVGGAGFEIYEDKNLTEKISFLPGFRRYTVCSEANAKSVDEIHLDNSGRATIVGLKNGTYYIKETKPANEYEPVLDQPIELQFTYDESELPNVKLINKIDDTTVENTHVEMRRGPQILIDYGEDKFDTKIIIAGAVVLILAGVLVANIRITVDKHKKETKAENDYENDFDY